MKKLFGIILLLSAFSSFSQDNIYLKNSDKIKSKVLEVTDKALRYKKHENLEGPDYWVQKKDILMVVYNNGNHEVYGEASQTSFRKTGAKEGSIDPENYKNHIVSLNYGDLLFGRIHFSYEFLAANGKLGFEIPFGQKIDYTLFNDGPSSFTGIDINFYPLGQRKVTYFTGFGMRAGVEKYQDCYYYSYDYYGSYDCRWRQRVFTGAYINNGLSILFTEGFSITGRLGVGGKNSQLHANGELSINVRL